MGTEGAAIGIREGPAIGIGICEDSEIGIHKGSAIGICGFALICTGTEGPAAAGKLSFGSGQRLP